MNKLIMAVTGLLGLTLIAQAAFITLDDFTQPLAGATMPIVYPPGPLTLLNGPIPVFGTLNANRLVSYSITPLTPNSPTVDSLYINATPYGSKLVETADDRGGPDVTLDYTGFVASLKPDVVLVGYHTDSVPEVAQAWYTDTFGHVTTSGPIAVAGNFNGDLTLHLGLGTVDLNNINEIQVEIIGNNGADFTLNSVTTSAPETSLFSLMSGLGLIGFGTYRYMRKV